MRHHDFSDCQLRPRPMVDAARWGAERYRRRRDLPGAIPMLLGKSDAEILATLLARESDAEASRRAGAPGYRPARHLQILAALIAERRAAGFPADPTFVAPEHLRDCDGCPDTR